MKAEYLCLQAFGSYRERTEVDFTLLGESPLFLITGSTGGGKTTLLDAMCFALYCRSTGGRRSWGSMRNMQAEDSEADPIIRAAAPGSERPGKSTPAGGAQAGNGSFSPPVRKAACGKRRRSCWA